MNHMAILDAYIYGENKHKLKENTEKINKEDIYKHNNHMAQRVCVKSE